MIKRADQLLDEAAALYRERNKDYGDTYLRFGKVMKVLFPTGLELDTVHDFNRIGILVQIVNKVCRYTNLIGNDSTNEFNILDSLRDLKVYAAMLEELEGLIRNEDHSARHGDHGTAAPECNAAGPAAPRDGNLLDRGQSRPSAEVARSYNRPPARVPHADPSADINS